VFIKIEQFQLKEFIALIPCDLLLCSSVCYCHVANQLEHNITTAAATTTTTTAATATTTITTSTTAAATAATTAAAATDTDSSNSVENFCEDALCHQGKYPEKVTCSGIDYLVLITVKSNKDWKMLPTTGCETCESFTGAGLQDGQ